MLDAPDYVPAQIVAGDSAVWNRSIDGYKASDGWDLKYTIVSSTSAQSWTATADGDGFSVSLTKATTTAWAPDRYTLTEYVDNGTDRYTLATMTFTVAPDLAGATGGIDTRTHAQKVLEIIETYLETKAPGYRLYWLGGRKLESYPIPELLQLRDRYKAMVLAEQRRARGVSSTIRVEFR